MIHIKLRNQKKILDFHYKNLTDDTPGNSTVLTLLQEKIDDSPAGSRVQFMYQTLMDFCRFDTEGKSIFTMQPYELESFMGYFEVEFENELTTPRRKSLRKIFYYSSYDKWNAYGLALQLPCRVCPYCNRSYTFVFDDHSQRTRFEYDHFFSQARYPYLSLSFFNLIPSCHTCNAVFKGTKEFDLSNFIHPYLTGFGQDMVFTITPSSVGYINTKPEPYVLALKKSPTSLWTDEMERAARNNFTVFGLEQLYDMHKDYVNEIIQKSLIYNSAYVDALYHTYQGHIFSSREDVLKMVLGNYISEEKYGERVLAKLTADISKELGLV